MNVLEEILSARKIQLKKDQERTPLTQLEDKIKKRKRGPDFFDAVSGSGNVSLIAEMKRKSPSAGLIRDSYDPGGIAKDYEKAGAAALSILTEPDKFGGRIEDIDLVSTLTTLPILRKDFLFDPYQIMEARAYGASAVLLIADMLDPLQLKELVAVAHQQNLAALVEVFTNDVVNAAINSGSRLIGINTRNLKTLEMLPQNIEIISKLIPSGFSIVAESGIKTPEDMVKLKKLKVKAALVGESLLKQNNIETATRVLVEAGK